MAVIISSAPSLSRFRSSFPSWLGTGNYEKRKRREKVRRIKTAFLLALRNPTGLFLIFSRRSKNLQKGGNGEVAKVELGRN